MSSRNYSDVPEPGEKTQSCLGCILLLLVVVPAIAAAIPIKGFWLSIGMFFTVLISGIVGSVIGGAIGNAVRNFAVPRIVGVDGGIGDIAWGKVFWLMIPQLTGIVLGWAIMVHLALLLIWGLPLSSLGSELYVTKNENPSLRERIAHAKEAWQFVQEMRQADHKTKVDALLMVGIDAGSVVTVNEAIRLGADLNTPRRLLDKNGLPYRNTQLMSPLFAALSGEFSNGEEIALILIRHGADVNIRDDFFKGPTPLLYVLRNNIRSLVIPLIERGARLDVADVDGKTPLHHAVNLGYEKAALMMLERGASMSVKDRWGHTPWDYADGKTRRKIKVWLNKQNRR